MEKMYRSVPNTKLPDYHSTRVNPRKLNIGNDLVDIGDDHIDDEEEVDNNSQFDRDDDYMQVEEPE